MSQLAENDSAFPAITTTTVPTILMVWAFYAFSGAGVIVKFPLLKPVLISVLFIYYEVFLEFQ
jgi:hypothetical protein